MKCGLWDTGKLCVQDDVLWHTAVWLRKVSTKYIKYKQVKTSISCCAKGELVVLLARWPGWAMHLI
jgi:hypothetical protein